MFMLFLLFEDVFREIFLMVAFMSKCFVKSWWQRETTEGNSAAIYLPSILY